MNQLENKLRAKGIKPTYIRLKILDYLEKNKLLHPTVEMIYKSLREEIPTVSRTTIYNTLDTFCQKGMLIPIIITGTETRFDSNISPHHHFLCEKCGKIIDLDIECEYFKKGYVLGHKINELHGYFKGICRDCLKKEEGDNGD